MARCSQLFARWEKVKSSHSTCQATPCERMINWNELPSEIISAVCDYLSFSERRTLSMVSCRCRQIVNARREKFSGVIVRGMPSINYYFIDVAFDDGSRLRKEFSSSYCGTTDVKTVLTD
nr:Cyclin F-box domain containing protein [Haemonchus contortus]